MNYIKKVKDFFKGDDHISKLDLDRIYDVVDMFALDNNLGQEIIFDDPTLKDIKFFTKYESGYEMKMGLDNGTDINFRFYSNNLEFIEIEDEYGDTELSKFNPLVNRIRRMCPRLKISKTGPTKFNIKITKK